MRYLKARTYLNNEINDIKELFTFLLKIIEENKD